MVDGPHPEDDDYNESEDEDFDPVAAAGDNEGDASSSAEDNTPSATTTVKHKPKGKRKRAPAPDEEAEDIGFENSGDEAIVKRGTKRRKKQGQGHIDGDDSGGEGGFVKTRAMRAVAAEEQAKRPLATTEGATIDVDAIWKEMNDPNARNRTILPPPSFAQEENGLEMEIEPGRVSPKDGKSSIEEEMVEIEETYKFAGETQVTKKIVPRASEAGQKWLKEQAAKEEEMTPASKAKRHPDTGEPLLRPLRRISLWDPNPEGIVRGLPTTAGGDGEANTGLRVVDKSKLGWHTEVKAAKPTKKLNVIQKTALDWTAHVDETGDKEELLKAAKAKGAYLERRDFLDRVEARKEDEERDRRARVK